MWKLLQEIQVCQKYLEIIARNETDDGIRCVPHCAGKTFQLYSHNLIGLFEQMKKPGLAAQFQTHRFPLPK